MPEHPSQTADWRRLASKIGLQQDNLGWQDEQSHWHAAVKVSALWRLPSLCVCPWLRVTQTVAGVG